MIKAVMLGNALSMVVIGYSASVPPYQYDGQNTYAGYTMCLGLALICFVLLLTWLDRKR